jgi:hypothetical protein
MDSEWEYELHEHYDTFVELLVQFGYCKNEDVADDWLSTELNADAMMDAVEDGYPHKARMRFILDMIYHMDLDCYPNYSETSIRHIANLI